MSSAFSLRSESHRARRHRAAEPAPALTSRGDRPRVSAPVVPPYLARKCASVESGECGCAACATKAQATLSVPSDPFEREADAIADHVMRSPAGSAPMRASHSVPAGRAVAASGVLPTGNGRALDASVRQVMEPRFASDFGSVRVHDDLSAAGFARRFAARAYTVGEHVVFGAGEYQPHGDAGRRLIAHELAHVVQQRRGSPGSRVQRTVDPTTFSCPANRAGAPADPFTALDAIDRAAQGLAEAMAIFGYISSVLNPATGTSAFDLAYQTRFGRPQAVGARFRNRFTGALRATEEEAAQEEITVIADRFSAIRDLLGGSIRYKCRAPGSNYTLGGCTGSCSGGRAAEACSSDHQRAIGICPPFWRYPVDNQRAAGLIHEAAHMRFGFSAHGSGNRVQRGRNPECYASMVADTFGFAVFDRRCPPI